MPITLRNGKEINRIDFQQRRQMAQRRNQDPNLENSDVDEEVESVVEHVLHVEQQDGRENVTSPRDQQFIFDENYVNGNGSMAEQMNFLRNMVGSLATTVQKLVQHQQNPPVNNQPSSSSGSRNQGLIVQHNAVARRGQNQTIQELILSSQSNQFAQLQNLLSNFDGRESRSKILDYFNAFELMTDRWTKERRAALLAIKLVGHARIIYEGLSDLEKRDYWAIKNACCKTNDTAKQSMAANKLLAGVRPFGGENLRDFGLRILELVRDSLPDEATDAVIKSVAKNHFLSGIGDENTLKFLAAIKDSTDFYELLDKAATVQSASALYRKKQYSNFAYQNNKNQFNQNSYNHNYPSTNFGKQQRLQAP